MPESDSENDSQVFDCELIPAPRTVGVPKRKRIPLTNARGVRRELAATYHRLHNGEIDCDLARSGAFILRCLLEALRVDDLEARLTRLERR